MLLTTHIICSRACLSCSCWPQGRCLFCICWPAHAVVLCCSCWSAAWSDGCG